MKSTVINFEDRNTLGNLRTFLSQLLEKKIVHAVLVPQALPSKDGFVQSLITDSKMLQEANPLAPTMAVQSAKILSDLTSSPITGRIGAVLKPCELRAAIELTKFLQVDLDNIMTIAVDCAGTYEVRDFAAMIKNDKELLSRLDLEGFKDGAVKTGQENGYREACRICETPAPRTADIIFGLFGHNAREEMSLIVGERFENELQEKLSLELREGTLPGREKVIQKVIGLKKKERDKLFKEAMGQRWPMQAFSTCIRCHNCMNACPICYCKECVFDSSVFEHRSDQFLNWAHRKGAIRMPTDNLIFHLTRMSHMATSCVSCGMCDSACPSQLHVSRLFGLIGGELQEMFEYSPGIDPAAKPPVSVFKEDELRVETGSE